MSNDYDLVIVGAGSAGSVIAARACERNARVLLCEAGPDYPDRLPEDLRNGNNNSYTAHDWGFSYRPHLSSSPQPFPRGRVVGGSSAVGSCIALRGQPEDYDRWAAAAGNEWTWERCLAAFVKMESDAQFSDEPYHGSSGPVPIMRYRRGELAPIQRAFVDACDQLSIRACPDHNQPGSTGAGPTPLSKRGSKRVSAASAYLAAVRDRPTLKILPNTLTVRVVFNGTRVRGVELMTGGSRQLVDCPNVVLCAGAVMTPPILVRSGIGPRKVLDRLRISPVTPREGVGAHLRDHPATVVLLQSAPDTIDSTAPLVQTCLRTSVAQTGDLFVEPLSFVGQGRTLVGIAAAAHGSSGAGRLRFSSVEPDAPPVIEMRLFEDNDHDLDVLVEGVLLAMRIWSTEAVREIAPTVVGLQSDSLDVDEIRRHVRRFSGSGYDACGTAPMGHPDDPMAVCDEYGRVYGVTGLRVADASIMPSIPRASLNLPTMMIGERFGEWIADEL